MPHTFRLEGWSLEDFCILPCGWQDFLGLSSECTNTTSCSYKDAFSFSLEELLFETCLGVWISSFFFFFFFLSFLKWDKWFLQSFYRFHISYLEKPPAWVQFHLICSMLTKYWSCCPSFLPMSRTFALVLLCWAFLLDSWMWWGS